MPTVVQYEADHHPEVALGGGAHHLAAEIGLSELELTDRRQRRQALAAVDNEQFATSLLRLNALLGGNDPDTAKVEDGQVPSLVTPPLDDKIPLLTETIETCKDILKSAQLEDRYALRRAGLTLSGALAFIHPFKNGNGRTARLSHYLIEFGAERGDVLFEQEAFSAIGKTAIFQEDLRLAVDTQLPVTIEEALNYYCSHSLTEQWESADLRGKASIRVRAFLAAMSGKADIRTISDTNVPTVWGGSLHLWASG